MQDLQAGLVVGCMLIPQGMGYADVAGLPLIAGLYSGFAPLIIYFLTGSSRQMGIGPVAIVSLLVAGGVPACNRLCPNDDGNLPTDEWPSCPVCENSIPNDVYWQYATSIALMAGIIQVVQVTRPLRAALLNAILILLRLYCLGLNAKMSSCGICMDVTGPTDQTYVAGRFGACAGVRDELCSPPSNFGVHLSGRFDHCHVSTEGHHGLSHSERSPS